MPELKVVQLQDGQKNIKIAKGYWIKRTLYRTAHEQVMRTAYNIDRKQKH